MNETLSPQVPDAGLPFGIIDPDYATAFTKARVIAWQHGYALCMHGSFTRDLDLLAVPWEDRACLPPEVLVARIADVTGLAIQGEPTQKAHGRKAWSLLFPAFGDPRWIDLSVIAPTPRPQQASTTTDGATQ